MSRLVIISRQDNAIFCMLLQVCDIIVLLDDTACRSPPNGVTGCKSRLTSLLLQSATCCCPAAPSGAPQARRGARAAQASGPRAASGHTARCGVPGSWAHNIQGRRDRGPAAHGPTTSRGPTPDEHVVTHGRKVRTFHDSRCGRTGPLPQEQQLPRRV